MFIQSRVASSCKFSEERVFVFLKIINLVEIEINLIVLIYLEIWFNSLSILNILLGPIENTLDMDSEEGQN